MIMNVNKRYQLVEFDGEQLENGKKSIDCVPTKWTHQLDPPTGEVRTKFPRSPYTTIKDKMRFEKMVKEEDDALPEWPLFTVNVCGHADTYPQALRRLHRLESENNAYTTACEDSDGSKHQLKKLKTGPKKKKSVKLFDVPSLSMSPLTQNRTKIVRQNQQQLVSSDESGDEICDDEGKENKSKKQPVSITAVKKSSVKLPNVPSGSVSPLTPNRTKIVRRQKPQLVSSDESGDEICDDEGKENKPKKQPVSTTPIYKQSAVQLQPSEEIEKDANLSSDKETIGTVNYDMQFIVTKLLKIERETRENKTISNKILEELAAIRSERSFPLIAYDAPNNPFKLTSPLKTHDEFQKFDQELAENEGLRRAFMHHLKQQYDESKTISKNLAAILKKYLSREVALLFNARKKVEGKFLFKDTTFSECIIGAIDLKVEDRTLLPVTENAYLMNLGTVLSNAKDWGVSRKRPLETTESSEND